MKDNIDFLADLLPSDVKIDKVSSTQIEVSSGDRSVGVYLLEEGSKWVIGGRAVFYKDSIEGSYPTVVACVLEALDGNKRI